MQREPLVNGEIYHVMSKSIEGYEIFPQARDYDRMLKLIRYFRIQNPPAKFSQFLERPSVQRTGFAESVHEIATEKEHHVRIVSFCLMPTHLHFAIEQLKDDGISEFMRKILNGYAKYFNIKYDRKGHLWMDRFKSVHVTSDEQLLHLTRYIHLNPVTAGLVTKAELWPYSSYTEFVQINQSSFPLISGENVIDTTPSEYRKFVSDHAGYQRDLHLLKQLAI